MASFNARCGQLRRKAFDFSVCNTMLALNIQYNVLQRRAFESSCSCMLLLCAAILRSRQNGAESSAACVVEGAQRTRGDSAQAFPFVRIVYLREVFPAGFYFASIKKAARNGARCCMQCRQSVRWEQIVGERGRGALKCRWYAWRDKYFFSHFSTCTSAVVLFSQCVWRVSLMRGTGKHRAPRSAKRRRK